MHRLEYENEANALVKSSMTDVVMALNANQEATANSLKQASDALGKAAGEIQAIFNRKMIIHPDGTKEVDLSTIITISSDGARR